MKDISYIDGVYDVARFSLCYGIDPQTFLKKNHIDRESWNNFVDGFQRSHPEFPKRQAI